MSAGTGISAYTLQKGLGSACNMAFPGSASSLSLALSRRAAESTGRVNPDGTVTIFAITSTISASGDQGADPNRLVTITDRLAATSLPANEQFNVLETAGFGQVLRGVALARFGDRDDFH